MKPPAWRRDPAQYVARYAIAPRFTDVDTLRHMNNSALHGLHQEARHRFLAERIGDAYWRAARGPRLRATRSSTDFLLQAHYPQPIEAAVAVGALDEQHLVLATALFQDGQCVGLQTTQLQALERSGPIQLPPAWRQALPPAVHALDLGAAAGAAPRLPTFPLRSGLDSRYADLDATGRTSELALMRAAENGRSGLLRAAFEAVAQGDGRTGLGTLVARADLHVLHALPPPPRWTLATGVTHLGRSSAVLRMAFFDADGRCHAWADCVQVFVDRAAGTPVPMPDAAREVLDRHRVGT